jgi:hypothetical protein
MSIPVFANLEECSRHVAEGTFFFLKKHIPRCSFNSRTNLKNLSGLFRNPSGLVSYFLQFHNYYISIGISYVFSDVLMRFHPNNTPGFDVNLLFPTIRKC